MLQDQDKIQKKKQDKKQNIKQDVTTDKNKQQNLKKSFKEVLKQELKKDKNEIIDRSIKKEPGKISQQKVDDIIRLLDKHYGTEVICYLEHRDAWQLLVATILSAQCTDARVNIVTKDLFLKYPTPETMAAASQNEMEEMIHSTGFYHNKAKNLIACAREILHRHQGFVPKTVEELTALPGVGRKTANVILGNIYGIESIVVDTHVKRISKKLGLTKEDDPEKIEYDLMRVLPKDHWILFNIQVIAHGRSICPARQPKCTDCFLKEQCEWLKDKSLS